MEKIQKVCAGAFVFRGKRILLLKRSSKETFLPRFWDIPSGKLKFGEDIEEGVRRETKEETGLKIKIIAICSAFSYLSRKGSWHNTDIQYVARPLSKKIKLDIGHTEFAWVSEGDVKKMKISKELKMSIKKCFKIIKNL
jgi:ADP-ribose pyrophosphatase YjhB (NUDIX family)